MGLGFLLVICHVGRDDEVGFLAVSIFLSQIVIVKAKHTIGVFVFHKVIGQGVLVADRQAELIVDGIEEDGIAQNVAL